MNDFHVVPRSGVELARQYRWAFESTDMAVTTMNHHIEGSLGIHNAYMAPQALFLLWMVADVNPTSIRMHEMLDLASSMENKSSAVMIVGMLRC